ncbi:MAG: hypothetical protein ACREJ9_01725 [Candidatus Rokuibacteriota bacterium]
MAAVATTLKDLQDQFKHDVASLEHLVAAYFTVEMDPPKVHVWTLLDARDEFTADEIARAEHKLVAAFPGVGFDFTTVHLRGRDPMQFIPDAAVLVKMPNGLIHQFVRERVAASS